MDKREVVSNTSLLILTTTFEVKGVRDMSKETIVVKNKSGLHARPAALFVKTAKSILSSPTPCLQSI